MSRLDGTGSEKRLPQETHTDKALQLQNNQPMNEEQRKYSEDLIRKIQEVK